MFVIELRIIIYYMDKIALVLVAIAATHCPVYARPNGYKVPIIKVPYSQSLPKGIIKRLPHGYQSRFYGTTQIDAKSSRISFHFYEGMDQSKNSAEVADYQGREDCAVDIFTASHGKRGSSFQRINSIHFKRLKWRSSEEKYGLDILWLDPQQKHMPIIRLTLEDSNGAAGVAGSYILIVLPTGWMRQAYVQEFSYGATNSSDGDAYYKSFDNVDERGLLMVEATHYRNTPELNTSTTTEWRWTGTQFAEVKK